MAIISYNSGATLPRCLDALAAQTFRDFELVLIDNASAEPPDALIEGRPFPVTYAASKDNLGFAGGMNEAMARCKSPYLAALNPDAYAARDWLAKLVAAAEQHPDIAAFGSLQLNANDEAQLDGFGDHYLVTGQAWRGTTCPAPTDNAPAYCFGVCAAAALYRADIVRELGGFDARFFCFYEDVDLSFRLRRAGHACAVIPDAIVHHVGGASFEGKSELADFLITRNAWWTLIKNMPWPALIFAAPAYIAIQVLSLIKRYRRSRLKGLREGFARTPEFLRARGNLDTPRRASFIQLMRWISFRPSAFFERRTLTRPQDQ
ncbi:MAG: glycosyltransferase family 2 protein [Rhodobacteraceae bacterium]|nr:glycosyltransferase family 2 protein [Paracoccaceae bacterium]